MYIDTRISDLVAQSTRFGSDASIPLGLELPSTLLHSTRLDYDVSDHWPRCMSSVPAEV
jgi:hypothetical protein